MDERTKATARLTRERWEANADYWVKVIRERHDRYRTELTDRAVLDAIGDCAGLDVLDAGCGEGYLARILAGRGARVRGVDAAQNLVDAAASEPVPGPGTAEFTRASVDDLPCPDASFDLAVCNHLFSHLPDPGDAIAEFGRVLRPGGRLVILTLHPCFYVHDAERGSSSGVGAVDYFRPRGIDQRFLVDGMESPAMITSWLRPLEDYAGTLRDSGFTLADLREPHPTVEQLESDPWWSESFPVPLFLLLVAERR